MFTLLTTIVSFLSGGIPRILDFFQDRNDKKHELDMANIQFTREDGVVLNNTNINLGKGDNGKYYGMRFNPTTLTVEFFENIGTSSEVKTGGIKVASTPIPPPTTPIGCTKKTGLINCK